MRINLRSSLFFRYIVQEISTPFLGATLFFVFILLMFQLIRLSDFLVVHSVAPDIIFRLLGYLILSFFPVVLPIAFLLAVLVGFGRLSSDAEITAMRAAGVSIYSFLLPVGFIGVLVFLATLMLNLYLVPWGNYMFRYEVFRISNTKAIATIHEGTFTEGFFDLVVYADKVESSTNDLKKVFIFDEQKGKTPVTIVSKRGKIFDNQRDEEGTPGLLLRLFDGALYRFDKTKLLYEYVEFLTYDIFLKIETAKVGGVEKPKTMSFETLKSRIKYLQRFPELSPHAQVEFLQLQVEFWKRYALSFSSLIFAIMGVAFGVIRVRTVRSNSVMICLLVLLIYWVIYSVGVRLSEQGKVPAFMGMWFANILLLVVSLFTLKRVAR